MRGQSPSIKKLGHVDSWASKARGDSGSFLKIDGMVKKGDTDGDRKIRNTTPVGTIGLGREGLFFSGETSEGEALAGGRRVRVR